MANVARFDGASTVTTSCGHNAWNQLVMFNGDPGNSRQYDLNGCLYHETSSDKYFNHDHWGRLKSVAAGAPNDVIARYTYDFAGRLILRTAADGSKERYYYDTGLSRVLVRVKPAGASTWKTKHVYALNGGVAGQVLAERTVTAWSGSTPTAWNDIWLHYDLLGNVVGWHGPSGEFTRADRDAYGRPLPGTIAAQTPSGYGLTTKPREPATGLVWFGARWYDPDNGRWIEPEPTGADGTNKYWYGLARVTTGIDWDGLAWYDRPIDVIVGGSYGAFGFASGFLNTLSCGIIPEFANPDILEQSWGNEVGKASGSVIGALNVAKGSGTLLHTAFHRVHKRAVGEIAGRASAISVESVTAPGWVPSSMQSGGLVRSRWSLPYGTVQTTVGGAQCHAGAK